MLCVFSNMKLAYETVKSTIIVTLVVLRVHLRAFH